MRLISDFSVETIQARRKWDEILKVLKEKTASQEYSCLTKLSFISEGEIMTFLD